MSPSDLAQRIAALDWNVPGLPLQNLLAVTAAVETLRTCTTQPVTEPATVSNVVPLFPVLSPEAERILARGCSYVPERRVCLTLLDGTPFADALCARTERWDWIVETVCDELGCSPDMVACDDDMVTVEGMPCYLIA